MRILVVMLLVLAMVMPAGAENFYQYQQHVAVSEIQVMQSPGVLTFTFMIPSYAILGPAYVKHCAIKGVEWDGSDVPEDIYVTMMHVRSNYTVGVFPIQFKDTHPGRTYQVCLRLPWIPLE